MLIANFVFVASFSSGIATAQASDPIYCGLWAGANLDVNAGLNCNTSSKKATNTPTTEGTPGRPTPSTSGTYVALGDSVAAGYGLPLSTNATSQDQQCKRSPQGYPNLVAKDLGMPLVNAACSGATVGDLFTRQGVDGPNIPAQLNTAFASGTPKLISITAGANDVEWDDYIQACYALDCTRRGYDGTISALITVMKGKYHIALTDIHARSNGKPPKVLMTGYYNPLSTSCVSATSRITSKELTWLNAKRDQLNNAIRDVARQYSFAEFVPINNFTGHDICSADSWIQQNMHPTARGQQAIAQAVTAAYRN
jgi:lysophospholipase L1-like esterase